MILHFYFSLAFKILKIDNIFKYNEVFILFFNQLISNMLGYNFAKFSQIQIETFQMMLLSIVIYLPKLYVPIKPDPNRETENIFFRIFFLFVCFVLVFILSSPKFFSPYLFQANGSLLQEPPENITCCFLIFSESIEMECWLKMS